MHMHKRMIGICLYIRLWLVYYNTHNMYMHYFHKNRNRSVKGKDTRNVTSHAVLISLNYYYYYCTHYYYYMQPNSCHKQMA